MSQPLGFIFSVGYYLVFITYNDYHGGFDYTVWDDYNNNELCFYGHEDLYDDALTLAEQGVLVCLAEDQEY